MKPTRLLGAGALILAGLIAGKAAASTAQPAVQDDVKQVFLNKCAVCHGEDGKGQTAKGKKLKMKDIRSPEVQK
jgi:mono/diheme cytochrome c family protein